MKGYFEDKELACKPPIKRAAYSDRTAWILAEISRLVYEKLPVEVSIKQFMTDIEKAVNAGDDKSVLEGLIRSYCKHGDETEGYVADVLSEVGFEYLNSYAEDGTEALLCKLNVKHTKESMLVIAFRGTQISIKDVLTDLKAKLVDAKDSGRIHEGFSEAFDDVSELIK